MAQNIERDRRSQAFGDVVRARRLKAGLSQETLALECDLHPTFISMLERGVRQPSLETIFRLAARLGVRVGFLGINAQYGTDSPGQLCDWPFERAYATSDGRVVPCCTIGNPDTLEIAADAGLAAAWNGDAYQAFRRAHLDGRIPEPCQDCYKA